MRALIFGGSGQDAFYLNKILQSQGYETILVSRSAGEWITGDISDRQFVEGIIKQYKPEYIFHMAANSSVRHELLFENHETICSGTLNILESVYSFSNHTKVFLSGSALQFVNNGYAISENDPFIGSSPYSIARIHSVYAARYYRSLGLKVYVGYFFNHDSPLRSVRHVNQKIVVAAKRIAAGSTETLEMDDITVKKEFSFAGDIMKAVWTLVQNDSVYECVIGSGKAYSIEQWLSICFQRYNLDWKLFVSNNTNFKKEYDILVSDPRTIFSLGWKPELDINELADLMLNQ
jgi:GDPmannose 4,6-dehydratase